MEDRLQEQDIKTTIRSKRRKPINWGAVTFVVAHLLPAFILVIIFYVYCNIESFFMAFQRQGGDGKFTMENFEWFFKQFGREGGLLKEAFLNTLMWWAIQMFLIVFGLFTSYFIYKEITGSKIFRIVFLIPGLISSVVMAFMITRMLGAQGFIARWVQKMDGLAQPPDLLRDDRYAMKWLVIKSFPFAIATNMLIWVGTMSRIPDSVIESAKIDGANWLIEMFRIVLPMILPAVGITLCSAVSGLFTANGGEFLYTQGQNGTMTLNTWLYLQIWNTSPQSNTYNQVSAVGWIMTLVLAPIILLARHWMNKIGEVEY